MSKKMLLGKRIVIEHIPADEFKSFKGLCVTRDVSMTSLIRALISKAAGGDVALIDRICK